MEQVIGNYKQTEIGLIPIDWNIYELNSLIDLNRSIRYGIVQPGKYDPNGRFMVRGQDYSFGWVDSNEMFRVTPEVEERYKNARLTGGDIILTIVGAGTGKLEVVPDWLHGANITQTTARIAVDKQKANSNYCKYYFQSAAGKIQISLYVKGAAQPGLNIRDVKIFKIPLPPKISEQTAIATALSDTDNYITHLEKLIAKKRLIKQGAMQELLRPKKGWVVKKLGEIATFYKGKGLPKSHLKENGKYKCIHYGELFTKYKESINTILSYTDKNDNCFYSVSNDVLMPTSDVTPNGLATASCIKEDGVILGGDVLVIRISPSLLDGIFFSFYVTQNREQVMKLVSGSTVYHLSGSDMMDFEIVYPKIEEQNKIATILSDMDAEIITLEKKLAKALNIKQGMMQQLLTGKIRLV